MSVEEANKRVDRQSEFSRMMEALENMSAEQNSEPTFDPMSESNPASSVTVQDPNALLDEVDQTSETEFDAEDADQEAVFNSLVAKAEALAAAPAPTEQVKEEEPYVGLALVLGPKVFTSRGLDTKKASLQGIIPQLRLVSDLDPNLCQSILKARMTKEPPLRRLTFSYAVKGGSSLLYGLVRVSDDGMSFEPVGWRGFMTLKGGPGCLKTTLYAAVAQNSAPGEVLISGLGEHSAVNFGRDVPNFLEDVNAASLLYDPEAVPTQLLLWDGLSGLASAMEGNLGEGGVNALMFSIQKSITAWCDLSLLSAVGTMNVPASPRNAEGTRKRTESAGDCLTEVFNEEEARQASLVAVPPPLKLQNYPGDTMVVCGIHRRRSWKARHPVYIVLPREAKLWELVMRKGAGAWSGSAPEDLEPSPSKRRIGGHTDRPAVMETAVPSKRPL